MIIVRAAIMFSDGEIVEGSDYGHIIEIASRLSMSGKRVNGFITSTGNFVLPEEATKIAIEAGQVEAVVDELTPEDLWPYLAV